MTYEFLKAYGTYLGDNDLYSNGIYCGTDRYYLYNNELYRRSEPDNRMSYRGQTKTEKIIGDFIDGGVSEQLAKYEKSYFTDLLGIPGEIYEALFKMSTENEIKASTAMTSKSLRTASGMTQKELSEFLGIPVRSIENWDSGATTPPAYVLELIRYKLEKEGCIPENQASKA